MTGALALLFDFGGTLDADGVYTAPRFHAAYRASGGALDAAAFEPVFAESERALAALPGIETLGYRDAVAAQARLIVASLPAGDRADAGRIAERFDAEARAAVARHRPVLERLASRYRMAVVSNFTGNLDPCLEDLGLRRFFGVRLDSAVVGIRKPDPRIFRLALERLGVGADRAWMIGDNIEADVRAAARVGIKACWLAPAGREVPAGPAPLARIARLEEIEGVLAAPEHEARVS